MTEINTPHPKKWYVVYTRSRAEKKVFQELQFKNIECYLPLQKKLRQWKDRKKWVEMPLIPGYCFVHIGRHEYDVVLQTNHVVGYVTFEGKAVVIPGEQISGLKQMLKQYEFDVAVSPGNLKKGKVVEIIAGALSGLCGELVQIRGKNRFILRIEQINTIFHVEIPSGFITFLPDSTKS